MNDVEEVLSHPQVVAETACSTIEVPGGEHVGVLRAPFNIQGLDEPASAIPAVGEHTDAVLAELGYGDEEIAALHEDGCRVKPRSSRCIVNVWISEIDVSRV